MYEAKGRTLEQIDFMYAASGISARESTKWDPSNLRQENHELFHPKENTTPEMASVV